MRTSDPMLLALLFLAVLGISVFLADVADARRPDWMQPDLYERELGCTPIPPRAIYPERGEVSHHRFDGPRESWYLEPGRTRDALIVAWRCGEQLSGWTESALRWAGIRYRIWPDGRVELWW